MKNTLNYLASLVLLCGLVGCGKSQNDTPRMDYLACATTIAQSEMKHNPELWMADFLAKPKWDYTQGLVAKAMLETYLASGDTAYLNYVQAFADYFLLPDGTIRTYDLSKYNLDRVNGGNFIYLLDSIRPHKEYEQAIELLRSQLASQPRTSEGGFWHKQIYPSQMWLDGLYMAEPFYAHYAVWAKERTHTAVEDTIFDDVVRQFRVVDSHTRNAATGLNYHGWDESNAQAWADSVTGCSPHTWGRAEGWYVMAICDVLDYLPRNHEGREELIQILRRVCDALLIYQDKETKMWYQVLDMPTEEGNYTEATCSAMFCYAMAKGARMGYLRPSFGEEAKKAFGGLWRNVVVANEDGTVSLTRCCAVAGLGGNPYRSGTYEYYINEKVRDNDPKGIGPLILAALELNKLEQTK